MMDEQAMAAPEEAPAGKCVEISMSADGSFTVYECEPKEEMAMGEEEGEPAGQSFDNMDEALQAAAELLTSDTRSAEDQQMAGYQKGAKPASDRPSVGAVFGEGM